MEAPQRENEQQKPYNREEEYLAAQRASLEALHVGRATLDQAQRQGEQLQHANQMADETDYKLQKAARVLRGMTWSGWVANIFSKSVGPPPDVDATTTGGTTTPSVPEVYEDLPPVCQDTAQNIKNYHANVKVLEACETEEQKTTCQIICDNMFQRAVESLDRLRQNHAQVESYALQLARDVEILRNRQLRSQQRIRGLDAVVMSKHSLADAKKQLMPESSPTQATAITQVDVIQQQQDQHLETLSQALGELGSIALTLNQTMADHNETLDELNNKSSDVLEKQHMVNRRTERLIQSKSWSPVKATFHATVSIRHIATGLYLSVRDKGDLHLVKKYHPETCVFGLWKRQGQIFGLKSEFSRKWVGQSMFGSLACSAASFGRREEWEASAESSSPNGWRATKLLCASAGWGNGGYLLVRRKDFSLVLGGSSPEDRENAAVWCIAELGGNENE